MVSDYDELWLEETDALCVSVVSAGTPEAAARAIAMDGFTEFSDAATARAWVRASDAYDRSWFATGAVGGHTFVWEDNGWQGVTQEAGLRLAGGGQLVSMFWNVNSVMTFLVLRDGRAVRRFDPLFHDDAEPPTPVIGEALPAEAGFDWEDAPRLSGLDVLARVAETPAVEPAWLTLPGVRFWGHRF